MGDSRSGLAVVIAGIAGISTEIGDIKNRRADLEAVLAQANDAASANATKIVASFRKLDEQICLFQESLRPASQAPVGDL